MDNDHHSIFVRRDFGRVSLRLEEVLKEHKITRTGLSKATGIRYDILQRYYDNTILRMDKEILAKICFCLGCELDELLVYHRPDAKADTER